METVWINGEYMPIGEATVPIEDRCVLFGDGIYEVLAAYDGTPILMEEHLDRWDRSAAGINLSSKYSREERVEVIGELVRRLNVPRAMIYGQLSRGAARRTHHFPERQQPIEFWFARELPPRNNTAYEKGVSVITHPDERWRRCWIKSTCLLANVLAKQKAVEQGCFEAVLYTDDNYVTEVSAANFWIVRGGKVLTHPADGSILAGCKRAMVLQVARQNGIQVVERKFTLDEMRGAEEAFITSTTLNIMPVIRVDGREIGTGAVGATTKELSGLVEDRLLELKRETAAIVR